MKEHETLKERAIQNILITGLEVMVVSTEDKELEQYIGQYGTIITWNIQEDGLHLKLKFEGSDEDIRYFMEDDVKEVVN